MKKLFFAILYVITLIVNIGYSADTTSINYLPLKIGNKFIYTQAEYGYGGDTTFLIKVSIDRDSIINSHKYFYCERAPWGTGWFRTDSLTSCIYKFDSTNSCSFYYYEILTDSIKTLSNGWNRCGRSIVGSSISASQFWGTQTYKFHVGMFFQIYISIWKEYHLNFGFTKYEYIGRYSGYSITLKGCLIDGIVYGDTAMPILGLETVSNEIPVMFSLSQNYPNPFNPQTKIKFDVPSNVRGQTSNLSKLSLRKAGVKLIIYDLLGREVTTLVNEELKPGTYEADWDGSNYSSGVYFYKIISGDFVETKKMVLMK